MPTTTAILAFRETDAGFEIQTAATRCVQRHSVVEVDRSIDGTHVVLRKADYAGAGARSRPFEATTIEIPVEQAERMAALILAAAKRAG